MAIVTPGELFVVVIIEMLDNAVGYDIHDEVFTNWEAADQFRQGLADCDLIGLVRKVTMNYS